MNIVKFIRPLLQPKSGTTPRKGRTQSSWVMHYGYARLEDGRQGLIVVFEPGTICFYECAPRLYDEMATAPSAGQFVWTHLMPKSRGHNTNYEILDSLTVRKKKAAHK